MFVGIQDRERQQILRGHRDAKQIESQLTRPNALRLARATEDAQRNFTPRNSGDGEKDKSSRES